MRPLALVVVQFCAWKNIKTVLENSARKASNSLRWCRARFSRNTISPFRGILFSILGEKMSTFFPWNFFPGIKCRHFSPGINISPPKLTFSRNNMSQRFPWPSHDVWNFWTAEKNDILFRKYWNFFHKIVTFFWFLCQGWFLKTGSKNFNNNFRK